MRYIKKKGGSASSGSVTIPTGFYLYFGDGVTNGSWRMRVSSNNLVMERLEAGVWNEKSAATP